MSTRSVLALGLTRSASGSSWSTQPILRCSSSPSSLTFEYASWRPFRACHDRKGGGSSSIRSLDPVTEEAQERHIIHIKGGQES